MTGLSTNHIFEEMPLRLVYAYEHQYFLTEGFRVRRVKESLESLLGEVYN
jgi:hypothetical protein